MKTKRIKVELEAGLRFLLKQRATGTLLEMPPKISYGAAAAKILQEQFAMAEKWDPGILMRRWEYTPPKPKEADDGEPPPLPSLVTSGLEADATLDDIIEGLHFHSDIAGAPLGHLTAMDPMICKMRIEVRELLAVAAGKISEMRNRLREAAGLSPAQYEACLSAVDQFKSIMGAGKCPPPEVVQACRDFMGLTGLTRRLPLSLPFTNPPPASAPDQTVHVPVSATMAHTFCKWHKETGIDQKIMVAALLVCGGADEENPQGHLDDLLEYTILQHAHQSLRHLFNLIKDYDSTMNGDPCPYPDVGLAEFLTHVADSKRTLRKEALALERVLLVAMAARWSHPEALSSSLRGQARHWDDDCEKAHNQPDLTQRIALARFLDEVKALYATC